MPGRAEALLQQVIKGGKWLKSKDEINWSEALLERLWLPGWHIWRIKSEKEKEKSCFTFDLQFSYLKGCKVKIHWHILWRPETECFYSAGYRNVSLKRSSNPKSAPRPKYTNQTLNASPLRQHVSVQSYFLVSKQDASGYMQRFTVAFVLFVYTLPWHWQPTNPCSPCGYCTLSLHSCHQRALQHINRWEHSSLVEELAARYRYTEPSIIFCVFDRSPRSPFQCTPVTPWEQMCTRCKWAEWRGAPCISTMPVVHLAFNDGSR